LPVNSRACNATCSSQHCAGATTAQPRSSASRIRVYDLATLTEAEARRLEGRRALFRILLDSEPGERGRFVWYDCVSPDAVYSSVSLYPGEAVEGTATVAAVFRRIVHPPTVGADGSALDGLTEYRLTQAVAVDVS
jgi:hypothetical protein